MPLKHAVIPLPDHVDPLTERRRGGQHARGAAHGGEHNRRSSDEHRRARPRRGAARTGERRSVPPSCWAPARPPPRRSPRSRSWAAPRRPLLVARAHGQPPARRAPDGRRAAVRGAGPGARPRSSTASRARTPSWPPCRRSRRPVADAPSPGPGDARRGPPRRRLRPPARPRYPLDRGRRHRRRRRAHALAPGGRAGAAHDGQGRAGSMDRALARARRPGLGPNGALAAEDRAGRRLPPAATPAPSTMKGPKATAVSRRARREARQAERPRTAEQERQEEGPATSSARPSHASGAAGDFHVAEPQPGWVREPQRGVGAEAGRRRRARGRAAHRRRRERRDREQRRDNGSPSGPRSRPAGGGSFDHGEQRTGRGDDHDGGRRPRRARPPAPRRPRREQREHSTRPSDPGAPGRGSGRTHPHVLRRRRR